MEDLPVAPVSPKGSRIDIRDVADAGAQPYEPIPEKLKNIALSLRRHYEGPSEKNITRREQLYWSLKLREFLRGNQYFWRAGSLSMIRSGLSSAGILTQFTDDDNQELYNIPVMQATFLSIVSVFTGTRQSVEFMPENYQADNDRKAAEAYNIVFQAFEKDEEMSEKAAQEVLALCAEGSFGSYVRTVYDGKKFGYTKVPVYQTVPFEEVPAQYECLGCMLRYDAPSPSGTCPGCGAPFPMTPNIPPVMGEREEIVGYSQIPNGRVVRDVVPIVELSLPWMAADQSEFPFISRHRELPRALVRAIWREAAKNLPYGPGESTVSGDPFDRRIRNQLARGTTIENRPVARPDDDSITVCEMWVRPWAFYTIENQADRDEMLRAYPNGARFVFAGDTLLEAFEDDMDERWEICHAIPGYGQIREPILKSSVVLQELISDFANLIRDNASLTMPITFARTRTFDPNKLDRRKALAGDVIGVPSGDKPLGEDFYQTQSGRLPEGVFQFFQWLFDDALPFISGVFPAIYGGRSPGNNTAEGIAREQAAALGRLNVFLQARRKHRNRYAELVVSEYARNGIGAVTLQRRNQGNQLTIDRVTPADLKHGSAVRAETGEEYPQTWSQQQSTVKELMNMPNLFAGWITKLSNAPQIKLINGIKLDVPGLAAYRAGWQEIDQLVHSTPTVSIQQVPDQMGNLVPQQVPVAAIGGVPLSQRFTGIDDHASILEAYKDFIESGQGEAINKMSPQWQNVQLAIQERMQAQAMAGAGMQAPVGGGGSGSEGASAGSQPVPGLPMPGGFSQPPIPTPTADPQIAAQQLATAAPGPM